MRHGKGRFQNHDGRFYDGTFARGELHGTGQTCDFRFIYEGGFKHGKIDGTGKS
jgi:hypothetical protein